MTQNIVIIPHPKGKQAESVTPSNYLIENGYLTYRPPNGSSSGTASKYEGESKSSDIALIRVFSTCVTHIPSYNRR